MTPEQQVVDRLTGFYHEVQRALPATPPPWRPERRRTARRSSWRMQAVATAGLILVAIGLTVLLQQGRPHSIVQPAAPTGGEQSNTAPTTPSATPSATPMVALSGVALSGVVYESTSVGRRPLGNVRIDISPFYQTGTAQTSSDAEGRYNVRVEWRTKVLALKSGYSQPCAAIVRTDQDRVLDLYLVADEILSTTGVPSSMPIRQPVLSGIVFERTPQGRQPVTAARVRGDFMSMGDRTGASAMTRSDAAGHYLLCGLGLADVTTDFGLGQIDGVWADKSGYDNPFLPIVNGDTDHLDIELTRAGRNK